MTTQRLDFLFLDGEPNPIAAAKPMIFAPRDFGLHFGGLLGTNCYRGFFADYEVFDDQLLICELHIRFLSIDRELLESGSILDAIPEFSSPDSAVFRRVPLRFTGSLALDRRSGQRSEHGTKYCCLDFHNGRLISRRWINAESIAEGFVPHTNWVDFGDLMWLPAPDSSGSR